MKGNTMLRKLASLFFEEEEEIVEEEDIENKGLLLPPIAKATEKKTPRIEIEPMIDVRETAKMPMNSEPPLKAATRIDIGPDTTIQKTKRTVSENKVVYEFQPVISPIFGISEKDKQTVASQITTPVQVTRHSPLQTIISPIYGVMKNNEVANEEFTEPVQQVVVNPPFDIKNFSLDELLSAETIAKEKALEQFSLFEDNPES